MQEVKWIKISTDIFDNRKIKQIESLPNGNAIIIVWIKLLCLAGTVNDCGYIYLTKEIPYTDQMLSTQFGMPITTIKMALNTFEHFGMLEVTDDIFRIANWEKYQNIEGMERIREQTRLRVAKCRERKAICNATSNATVTDSNAIDKEYKNLEKKNLENKSLEGEKHYNDALSEIVDRWNTAGFNHVLKLNKTTRRYHNVLARLNEYGMEAIMEAIDRASKSPFLHGKNDRNWQATFDWVFLPNNFPKVLEGNYDARISGIDDVIGDFLSRE